MKKVKKGESFPGYKQLYSMFLRRKRPRLFYLFEFEQNVRSKAVLYIQYIQSGDKTLERFITF